jgi:pimeloyl-ACP methyl ester carboxylesterase
MKGLWRILGYSLVTLLTVVIVVPLLLPQSGSGILDHRQSAGPDARFAEINGLDVHVLHQPYTGISANPPLILLLHGFGANVYSWREVMDDLSGFGNVLAYDRPAFGWTQRDTSTLNWDPYTEQAGHEILSQLIQRYATDSSPVVLIGHSAGGGVATHYALRFPEQVSALVLVAPAVQMNERNRAGFSWITAIPQVRRTAIWLFGNFTESGLALLESSWHDSSMLTPEIVELYTRPTEIRGWESALWNFANAPRNRVTDQQFSTLGMPVLVITGDDDRVVATQSSIALAGKLPDATLEVIAQSGHLPHEETPTGFLQATLRFLSNVHFL